MDCIVFRGDKGKYVKSENKNWCKNWTFTPKFLADGTIIMVDTYWSNCSDSLQIKVTEDNVHEFTLIFDTTKVEKINENQKYKYEKYYCLATDSGGWIHPKCYIVTGTKKSVNNVLEKIDLDINEYERKIKNLKQDRQLILEKQEVPSWY